MQQTKAIQTLEPGGKMQKQTGGKMQKQTANSRNRQEQTRPDNMKKQTIQQQTKGSTETKYTQGGQGN